MSIVNPFCVKKNRRRQFPWHRFHALIRRTKGSGISFELKYALYLAKLAVPVSLFGSCHLRLFVFWCDFISSPAQKASLIRPMTGQCSRGRVGENAWRSRRTSRDRDRYWALFLRSLFYALSAKINVFLDNPGGILFVLGYCSTSQEEAAMIRVRSTDLMYDDSSNTTSSAGTIQTCFEAVLVWFHFFIKMPTMQLVAAQSGRGGGGKQRTLNGLESLENLKNSIQLLLSRKVETPRFFSFF